MPITLTKQSFSGRGNETVDSLGEMKKDIIEVQRTVL